MGRPAVVANGARAGCRSKPGANRHGGQRGERVGQRARPGGIVEQPFASMLDERLHPLNRWCDRPEARTPCTRRSSAETSRTQASEERERTGRMARRRCRPRSAPRASRRAPAGPSGRRASRPSPRRERVETRGPRQSAPHRCRQRPRACSSRIARTRSIAPCQPRKAPANTATVGTGGRSNGAGPAGCG